MPDIYTILTTDSSVFTGAVAENQPTETLFITLTEPSDPFTTGLTVGIDQDKIVAWAKTPSSPPAPGPTVFTFLMVNGSVFTGQQLDVGEQITGSFFIILNQDSAPFQAGQSIGINLENVLAWTESDFVTEPTDIANDVYTYLMEDDTVLTGELLDQQNNIDFVQISVDSPPFQTGQLIGVYLDKVIAWAGVTIDEVEEQP